MLSDLCSSVLSWFLRTEPTRDCRLWNLLRECSSGKVCKWAREPGQERRNCWRRIKSQPGPRVHGKEYLLCPSLGFTLPWFLSQCFSCCLTQLHTLPWVLEMEQCVPVLKSSWWSSMSIGKQVSMLLHFSLSLDFYTFELGSELFLVNQSLLLGTPV